MNMNELSVVVRLVREEIVHGCEVRRKMPFGGLNCRKRISVVACERADSPFAHGAARWHVSKGEAAFVLCHGSEIGWQEPRRL